MPSYRDVSDVYESEDVYNKIAVRDYYAITHLILFLKKEGVWFDYLREYHKFHKDSSRKLSDIIKEWVKTFPNLYRRILVTGFGLTFISFHWNKTDAGYDFWHDKCNKFTEQMKREPLYDKILENTILSEDGEFEFDRSWEDYYLL